MTKRQDNIKIIRNHPLYLNGTIYIESDNVIFDLMVYNYRENALSIIANIISQLLELTKQGVLEDSVDFRFPLGYYDNIDGNFLIIPIKRK